MRDETGLGSDLSALRQAIDEVDDELLQCLHRRAELVRGVAAWKHAHARPFYVPERERQVIERLQQAGPGAFPREAIRAVFSEIMSACLSLEQRLQVAYLGPEATFTHQASRSRFGLSALYVPAATIAGVFAEVQEERAHLGVVPVESAAEGLVSHALDCLVDTDLVIAQEIVIEVEHCLLSRAEGTDAVQKVYGHPQALAACRGWLGARLPGRPLIEVASTALAARLAKDDPAAAAVASEVAGRLYDLRVAEAAIQDGRASRSRYLVVERPADLVEAPASGRDKTSILFALPETPEALAEALGILAEAGRRLGRIESRPSPRRGAELVFFVDVDGHAKEPALMQALVRLRAISPLVKVLGSYPSETGVDG